jgi:hypothetical protein
MALLGSFKSCLPKFELDAEDLWIQRERALLNISVHEKLMLELVTKSSYVENCSKNDIWNSM